MISQYVLKCLHLFLVVIPLFILLQLSILYEGDHLPEWNHIRVYPRTGGSYDMHHLNPLITPMCYPLMWPHGQPGWNHEIPLRRVEGHGGESREFVSRLEYAAFYIHDRANRSNHQHRLGKLFQQQHTDFFLQAEAGK